MRKVMAFYRRNAAVILFVLFVASIIPLLLISAYDYPMGDDLSYSRDVHNALLGGGSVLAVLRAAWGTVARTYFHWQGTYSAVFLMAFQPGVFASGAYALVPLIMLAALALSTMRLLCTVLCGCLHEPKRVAFLIGVPVLFLSVQYVPSPLQGFFWYNGAMYYTFFYSVMLLYFDMFIRYLRETGSGSGEKLRLVLLGLLAAVLGGANFVTALLALLGGVVILFWCFFIDRRRLLPSAVIQAVLSAGFLVSTLAPGNAVRQAKKHNIGALFAILDSLRQACVYLGRWTTVITLLTLLLLVPLLYAAAGRSGLKFRYPGLVLLVSFLLFASQSAPPYYAMGWQGDARLQDIIYYSYLWLLLINLFYFLGWLRKRSGLFAQFRKRIGERLRPHACRSARRVITAVLALLLAAAVFAPAGLARSSGGQCAQALLSGEAQTYGREMAARQVLYNDSRVKNVLVPELTVRPSPLYLCDIHGDPDYSNNIVTDEYYHKHSVATYPAHFSLKNDRTAWPEP